jgi:cytochrome c-type biogenesis protein CcmH/NrfG
MNDTQTARGFSGTVFALGLILALAAGFAGGWLTRDARGPEAAGQQGDPGQARAMAAEIDKLKASLAKEPKNAAAWASLGHLYFDSGQPAPAVEAYGKSLEIAPGDADVLTDMGVMYRELSEPAKAIACFDAAVAARPSHEIARFNKGIVLLADLGDKAGALAAFEALLKVNPNAKAPNGRPVSELIAQIRQEAKQKPGMLIDK